MREKKTSRHGIRGIFWRIFALSWTAMTLVGVGFSLYVAAGYPTERMERRAQRFMSSLGLQGEELLRVRAERGPEAVDAELANVASDLDVRIWLVADGQVMHGSEPPTASALALAGKASSAGFRERSGDLESIAVALRGTGGAQRWVIAVENPRPSPLMRALEREAQRLILIVVVAGLLSLLLARAIAGPVRRLREATRRIAEGDLSVRVMPELGRSSAELVELAQDFDRMAERLDALLESQRRLMRDVSHELRSPLARLGVALELARQRAGEGAQSALDRIERDALRLGELISEILQLTRLDAGVASEHGDASERLDFSGLVSDIAADVDFEARGKGRSVQPRLASDLWIVGHAELLRRAIENVMRNAVRFSPEGGEVEVSLARVGSSARLVVRDRGPGVPAEHLADIFRPFFRVEAARDRDTGGAGIGLAIAERSIRLHGGRVLARNAEGGGLEVTIELPIAAA